MRLATEPTTTLVVASAGPRRNLDEALGRLLQLRESQRFELVVARACPPEEYRDLEAAYPAVLFMPAADGSTARQLRAVGLTAAEGDIVRLVDDEHVTERFVAELGMPAPVPA